MQSDVKLRVEVLPCCGVGDVLPLLLEKWSAGLSRRAMVIMSRFCARQDIYLRLSVRLLRLCVPINVTQL